MISHSSALYERLDEKETYRIDPKYLYEFLNIYLDKGFNKITIIDDMGGSGYYIIKINRKGIADA